MYVCIHVMVVLQVLVLWLWSYNNGWSDIRPAMRKGTIHISMNKINFYQTMGNLLSINVVVSILVSVYWHQQRADTPTEYTLSSVHTI